MAQADLCVRNARVVTPSGTIDGGVAAEDGKIVAVGADSNLPEAERTIDAEGNYLLPGFIDPHVHWGLSRYEFEYHEGLEHDFETETRGAVHGGVTTVVNFLLQPDPYLPDMDFFVEAGEQNSYIDFAYHAIVHMSTGEGVDICKRFQEKGVNLHAETLPAFLTHTKDEEDLGVWGKISPPLRGEWSKKRLWQGLREGTVDYVGTDHCPHKIEFKQKEKGKFGDIWDAIPGDNNGIEYLLPVMMSEGVNKNRIGIERLVEVCAENNARRWGLYPRKGALQEGSDADMVIVDPEKSTVVDDDFYHTMEPGYSTMHGMELTGLPTHTIVGGEVVVEDDELVAEPGGRNYLPRGPSGVPSGE